HSDIGGSYIENESRLSDTSLKWMLDAAVSVGMKIDETVLRLRPDYAGVQHDEMKTSWIFRNSGAKARDPRNVAILHQSVIRRFALERVLHYDEMRPYRPENLRNHQD